ncbi:MAG TPA: hypothetical protein VFO60_06065 [Candidatus Dormibacteraeota bacterium]|nr:hypothetical protein [Candidatus Dormibacteraeota bacterium]
MHHRLRISGSRPARSALVFGGIAGLGISASLATSGGVAAAGSSGSQAAAPILPNHILVSKSVFAPDPNIVAGVTQLPPGCGGASDPCGTAVTGGDYPAVFNNDTVDKFFGVTSPITLEELNPAGQVIDTIDIPAGPGGMVTSFSSKSELSVNLSTGGNAVTFMGYAAPPSATDVSNGSTPGDVDPTDGDGATAYRVVGQMDSTGAFQFTETNAYSGDNGRGAILNEDGGVIYGTGNAGNGANPEPQGVVMGAGAQLIQPSTLPESQQSPGQPTPVGSFNVTQLGDPLDKSAKDDNFRGIAVSGNVLYYTKGSGGNGVDSVYFVDTSGAACPNGTGVPAAGASLPTTSSLTFNPNEDGKKVDPGVVPVNMCILSGFPTALASKATDSTYYPFGIWFANPTTLYVADEGAGDNAYDPATSTYTAAAASTSAGLQKWTLDTTTGVWSLAYTLQNGLNLGQPYAVPGYPTGLNDGPGGTGLPWAPATGGLRNMTGRVNPNGQTVTIAATTSTVSGGGDQGADPNQVVAITDQLDATTAPASESFRTLRPAVDATIYRGVSFTPGTSPSPQRGPLVPPAVPDGAVLAQEPQP